MGAVTSFQPLCAGCFKPLKLFLLRLCVVTESDVSSTEATRDYLSEGNWKSTGKCSQGDVNGSEKKQKKIFYLGLKAPKCYVRGKRRWGIADYYGGQ